MIIYIYIAVLVLLFTSCEKDITVDLPRPASEVVVDGYVETGLPPYILLSRNSGYFDPISSNSLNQAAESNAIVTISDGVVTVPLHELITTYNGYNVRGVYVAIDSVTQLPTMIAQPGKTYTLHITTSKGEKLSSAVKLNFSVALDSVWFKVQEYKDSLGFAWARLKDPDTLGNCYRWFAKRITKDNYFIAPNGSTFEDKFINGKDFDFAYNRGSLPNSSATDDNNVESGFYKKGDTVIVKFCAVDHATFQFWRDAENQIQGNGSPFSVPSNVKSNIVGGLGIFASYAPTFDTIYAK